MSYNAFQRYLGDLVDSRALQKVNYHLSQTSLSVNNKSPIFLTGLDFFASRGVMGSAAYVPLKGSNIFLQDCRFFLTEYSTHGEVVSEEIFDAKGPDPRISFLRRWRDKGLSEKIKNWTDFSVVANERLKATVGKIPLVFLPIHMRVAGFNFDELYNVIGEGEVSMHDGKIPGWKKEMLLEDAYVKRADAVIVDSWPCEKRNVAFARIKH